MFLGLNHVGWVSSYLRPCKVSMAPFWKVPSMPKASAGCAWHGSQASFSFPGLPLCR